MKFRGKMEDPSWYAELDRGIRFVVKVLHARGYDTCQSCEGGKRHSYPEPTVDLPGGFNDALGFGAVEALSQYGLPVSTVARLWNLDKQSLPHECLWRITFFRKMDERAEENPVFEWKYRPL